MNHKTLINQVLTRNEWYAVMHALKRTAADYMNEHGGVDLTDLADRIGKHVYDLEMAAQERAKGGDSK